MVRLCFIIPQVMVMNNKLIHLVFRYNCYTGLIQIGPYESDTLEITFFSSKTVK
jgi:hypothetical protein